MSSIDLLWLPKRVDVRLVVTLMLIFGPIISATLFFSYVYAAHELMEEVGRSLDADAGDMREIWIRGPGGLDQELNARARDSVRFADGFWVLDREDRIVLDGTPALRARRSWDPDPMWNSLWVKPGDTIGRSFDLDSLHRLILVIRAEHFVHERAELARGFWLSMMAGLLAAAAAALLAARAALEPLRQATAALEDVDAEELAIRLADRGTEDDVDRHARALNNVLARLDAGFARLRAFSSDVAHELRTPVNRLLNRAEIAALEAPRDSPEQDVLLEIRASTEDLARMIASLLLLAQADARHLSMSPERIEVATLFDALRELYEAVAQEHEIDLQCQAENVAVLADRTLLLRAIANLIDNAIRVAPTGSKVALRALRTGDEVRIEVEDAGPGIEERQREAIFNRFVRLDRSQPGSGLGLAIAKALVEAQGGRISAGQSSLGGTRMQIWLPLA